MRVRFSLIGKSKNRSDWANDDQDSEMELDEMRGHVKWEWPSLDGTRGTAFARITFKSPSVAARLGFGGFFTSYQVVELQGQQTKRKPDHTG